MPETSRDNEDNASCGRRTNAASELQEVEC